MPMPKHGRPPQVLRPVRNKGVLEVVVAPTPQAIPPVSFLAEASMRLGMKFDGKLPRSSSKAGQGESFVVLSAPVPR
eukprot:4626635-Alexandrium_andersonii.AAC.1